MWMHWNKFQVFFTTMKYWYKLRNTAIIFYFLSHQILTILNIFDIFINFNKFFDGFNMLHGKFNVIDTKVTWKFQFFQNEILFDPVLTIAKERFSIRQWTYISECNWACYLCVKSESSWHGSFCIKFQTFYVLTWMNLLVSLKLQYSQSESPLNFWK